MNEKVTEYIDALAVKLGVATEYVFDVLVRQQFAEGIADLIIGFAALAILAVLCFVFYKAAIASDDVLDGVPYLMILAVGLFIFGAGFLYSGVLEILNPEYYAIKEIFDVISRD